MLYTFEENRIIEVAKVKSDLRRDGGNGTATKMELRSRRTEIPYVKISLFLHGLVTKSVEETGIT